MTRAEIARRRERIARVSVKRPPSTTVSLSTVNDPGGLRAIAKVLADWLDTPAPTREPAKQ